MKSIPKRDKGGKDDLALDLFVPLLRHGSPATTDEVTEVHIISR